MTSIIRRFKIASVITAAALIGLANITSANQATNFKTNNIQLKDGTEVNYIEKGEGRPIIFIHGTLDDMYSWAAQVEELGEDYRAISYSRKYSYPNKNKLADNPIHSTLIEANIVKGLMQELNLETANIVGFSQGAYIAFQFAVENPELVETLTLAEAPLFAWLPDKEKVTQVFKHQYEVMTAPSIEAFKEDDVEKALEIFFDYAAGKGSYGYIPEEAKQVFRRNINDYKAVVKAKDMWTPIDMEKAKTLSMPILMMTGQKSILMETDDFIQTILPKENTTRLIIPATGHMMFIEAPKATLLMLKGFFASH